MTKVVKLKEDSKWLEWKYSVLDSFFLWGNRRLPFIFMYSGYLDGKKIWLPKWITLRQSEKIDKWVQDCIKNIKWE